MIKQLLQTFRKVPRALGMDLVRFPPAEAMPTDVSPEMLGILKAARHYTLTTLRRLASPNRLYPLLVPGGVNGLMTRVDYTCRMMLKQP